MRLSGKLGKSPEKTDRLKFFGKISFVQMPYLENPKGAREIGERIGRNAQSFEIKELIIAPYGYVNANELLEFLKGIRGGKELRLRIKRKSYARDVKEVIVYVRDLIQTFRDRKKDHHFYGSNRKADFKD